MIFPVVVRKMTGRLLRGHVVPVCQKWILSQTPMKVNNTHIHTLWLLMFEGANYHGESKSPRFNFKGLNFVTTTHAPMQEGGSKHGY